MTVQEDIARHWFQPAVPTDSGEPTGPAPRTSDAGPLTTRMAGQLSWDEAAAAGQWAPERLEVTQPFIPAIREQQPDFARRLAPDAVPAPVPPAAPAEPTAAPGGFPVAQPDTAASAPPVPAPEAAPNPEPQVAPRSSAPAAKPAPYRPKSLARRVVRRIIGPNLLRKDPVRKKK